MPDKSDLPPPEFVKPGRALIAYYRFGERSGRPLLICHGLAASALQFAADARFFAGKGHHVIVPELRGHGRSLAPANATAKDFSFEALAGDLRAVLDAVNVRQVDWIGNSLGGAVGLAMIAEDPDRLRSLASFGTTYKMRTPRLFAPVAPLAYRVLGRRLMAGMTASATTRNPQARALIRQILGEFDPRILKPLLINLRNYDFLDAAIGFPGKVLIIRGGRDSHVNRALRSSLAAMRGRANFTLVEVPQAGHCANLDAPETVRAALLSHLEGA